jgi:hypothetical protein
VNFHNFTNFIEQRSFTTPGFVDFDYSLMTNILLPMPDEASRLQVRAEMFNIFNSQNTSVPFTNNKFPSTLQA